MPGPDTIVSSSDRAATADGRHMLQATDVSIRFGGLQALDSVSVMVDEREIVGLIGPNGAGKTTFFNCLTGFYTPDTGQVLVKGEDVTRMRPDERTNRGIGRTFQHVGLVRSFTVLENLLVAQHQNVRYGAAAGMAGMPWTLDEEKTLKDRAFAVLDYLELTHLAHESLNNLSYGMLKQVEVAAVLATDPEILMLDEPLAGLGPEESEAFGDKLTQMRRDLGLTIVIIEHHVPFMLRVCDYVYVLNFGQLLAEGKPEQIRTNREVAQAYMGQDAATLA
jgi:branched-chain amino acid transport system ATP-binding protein